MPNGEFNLQGTVTGRFPSDRPNQSANPSSTIIRELDKDLSRTLQSVGMRCFVDCFEYFMLADRKTQIFNMEELANKMLLFGGARTMDSARGKAHNGVKIFQNRWVFDALEVIASSEKTEKEVQESARQLLEIIS